MQLGLYKLLTPLPPSDTGADRKGRKEEKREGREKEEEKGREKGGERKRRKKEGNRERKQKRKKKGKKKRKDILCMLPFTFTTTLGAENITDLYKRFINILFPYKFGHFQWY